MILRNYELEMSARWKLNIFIFIKKYCKELHSELKNFM